MADLPTKTTAGWALFIGALGMMASLMAVDVSKLADWHAAQSPAFVGTALAHFGVVTAAFLGGKLIPSDPPDAQPGGRRSSDPPPKG